MWKKLSALVLFLSLPLCFLSAQDMQSGDMQIIENQQAILSILPVLIELSTLREADLSKRETISAERESSLQTKESELQKKEQSISAREIALSQSEKDMRTLKNDVAILSESYRKEQRAGVWKNRAIVALSACLAGSIIYSIVK